MGLLCDVAFKIGNTIRYLSCSTCGWGLSIGDDIFRNLEAILKCWKDCDVLGGQRKLQQTTELARYLQVSGAEVSFVCFYSTAI